MLIVDDSKVVRSMVAKVIRSSCACRSAARALFTVLMPGTAAEQAIAFAHRLQQRLDGARITHGAEAVRIRISLGVAALGSDEAASVDFAAALQILERASVARPAEVLERLGPLLRATCARVGIELQEYLFLLRSR